MENRTNSSTKPSPYSNFLEKIEDPNNLEYHAYSKLSSFCQKNKFDIVESNTKFENIFECSLMVAQIIGRGRAEVKREAKRLEVIRSGCS